MKLFRDAMYASLKDKLPHDVWDFYLPLSNSARHGESPLRVTLGKLGDAPHLHDVLVLRGNGGATKEAPQSQQSYSYDSSPRASRAAGRSRLRDPLTSIADQEITGRRTSSRSAQAVPGSTVTT